MKHLILSLLLLSSFSVSAEPLMANCYESWEEGTPEPKLVPKYQILQDEHGYAEAYVCGDESGDCKFLSVLKPAHDNDDFHFCLVAKKKKFSICHGDMIISRDTSVGTLVSLEIAVKGQKAKEYFCDEHFIGTKE